MDEETELFMKFLSVNTISKVVNNAGVLEFSVRENSVEMNKKQSRASPSNCLGLCPKCNRMLPPFPFTQRCL